jgi:hypothetical protein
MSQVREGVLVTYKRTVSAIGVAFLLFQALALVEQRFMLAHHYKLYSRLYGALLRPRTEVVWQANLLPVANLAFMSALVWLFGHVDLKGSRGVQGLKLGLITWVVGRVPLWIQSYAEQPWPGEIVARQLGLELISMLIVGVTIAIVAKPRASVDLP